MTVTIKYRPSSLTFREFTRVDADCFPKEEVRQEDFLRYLAGDFWGAFHDGKLVGYCYVIRKPDFAWLARIGVSSSHRGRGVGRGLMERALRHCDSLGLHDILLYVESENCSAISLYRSLGFETAQSACQYVIHDPLDRKWDRPGCIRAIPMADLSLQARPPLPRDWKDLMDSHDPPRQHVLAFMEDTDRCAGYCRLSPAFPGCFPIEVYEPGRDLLPVISSLRPLLLPDREVLKLTFSSEGMDSECRALGLELNYRLFKMLRMGESGSNPRDGLRQ